MRRRLFFRVMVALLALAAWVTAEIAPALAGPGGELLLSADGTHWSTGLSAPLFDPAVLWVPGDARMSSFYVQNRGTTPAAVRLEVTSDGADLLEIGAVELQARVGSEAWHPIARAGSGVLNALAIGTDRARRVDVRAVFRAGARNATQASGVVLHFVVDLGQAVGAAPQGTSPGSLPATGAPAIRGPLLLAAVLIGAGAALVRRRKVVVR
ncbi:MAG: hypothetical protein ACJ72E_10865 [Marmoricola sp.]